MDSGITARPLWLGPATLTWALAMAPQGNTKLAWPKDAQPAADPDVAITFEPCIVGSQERAARSRPVPPGE